MGPIKLDTVVGPGGRVELTLPFPTGTAVNVIVRDAEADDGSDLLDFVTRVLG